MINKINRPFDVPGTMYEPVSEDPLIKKVEESQSVNKDENSEERKRKRDEKYKKYQEERKKIHDDGKGKFIDEMV